MMYQYHCACCNQVVSSDQKVCPECGSQHIRSPYGWWIFCVCACLFTAITFKLGHVYFNNQNTETSEKVTLLEALNQDYKK